MLSTASMNAAYSVEVDAVLSGYQGGDDIGAMILEAVALVKLRNPAANLLL